MERRIVEILRAGIWYHEDFEDIQKGDIFRMFETDGTPILGRNNTYLNKAVGDVYLSGENNVPTVETIEVDASDKELESMNRCICGNIADSQMTSYGNHITVAMCKSCKWMIEHDEHDMPTDEIRKILWQTEWEKEMYGEDYP